MKRIPVSDFKTHCLKILEELSPEGLEITKHGKTIAKVLPIEQQSMSLIGSLKGRIKTKGNILSTGAAWNAES